MIETDLRESRLPPKKRLNPYGPFAVVSLLEYGGLNLFSRFSEDVATRRAASL